MPVIGPHVKQKVSLMICNIYGIHQGRFYFGQLHIGHIDDSKPGRGRCVVLLNCEWNERMTASEAAASITGEAVDGFTFWKLSSTHRPIAEVADERRRG